MQAVIKRSDLTGDGPVRVLMTCEDNVAVDTKAFGDGVTVLSVPLSAIQYTTDQIILSGDWRNANKQAVASNEATRRIDAVFPEYSQRNSISETNDYILKYGADVATWPATARNRKNEIDRCWSYVNSVRAKATTMAAGALPVDPSSNSNWPTVISPYRPL